MQRKILLDSADKAVQFVKLSQESECEVDVVAGNRLSVDARSIMGVLTCLNKDPVILDIHGRQEEVATYLNSVDKYFVS